MGNVLAFAGSNSTTSINYALVKHTASLITTEKVALLNMANYPFPMYSEDHEKENGFSNSLIELHKDIKEALGLIISVNEHNGAPSAYFKNLMDWLSRLDRSFLQDKKILLMSTSPGKRGGLGAFEETNNRLTRFGAAVIPAISLPSFGENFDSEKGITSEDFSRKLQQALDDFLAII